MKRVPTVIAALLTSALSFGAMANNVDFPHLSTSGYGEVVATPDMAEFTVRVVETTMTAEQAKQSVDKVVSDFLDELTDQDVSKDNITSSNLYLSAVPLSKRR